MTDVDAVVVGAGLNGLVGAVALAQAGLRVLVLEAAERPGGALRTEEVTLPGFRHDLGGTIHAIGLASPALRALELPVSYAHPPVPLGHALAPGRSVLLRRSATETALGLGRDGRRWRDVVGGFGERWERLAATVLDTTRLPPPAPAELLRFGLHGAWPATTTLRAFREEPARALFAGLAAHTMLPLSAWTTAGYGLVLGALAHGVGWPVAVGGSQALADALVTRLESLGGTIETGRRVRSLDELPAAGAVLLDLTPRQLLVVAGERLPRRLARRLEHWRYGPAVFKVDWALDAPVPWSDPALAEAGTVHLGGSAAAIVASERAVADGRVSAEPFVLVVQPTVADPSRAPAGRHTLWAYLHVPNGWDGDATELIERRIEAHAPGFRERVLARHAMGPAALEAWDANLVGGDIGGGSADWRQFVARPRLAVRPWELPGTNLYLASASALPGGGLHGMSGWLAAESALRRLR